MNRYIQKLIQEQFSISDLDFSDDGQKYGINIFNKSIVNPKDVYNKLSDICKIYNESYIISDGSVIQRYEIEQLDNIVAAVEPDNNMLQFISIFYSANSMNWLDVSNITDMSKLFGFYFKMTEDNKCTIQYNNYNGDISKWNTAKVNNMKWMFFNSYFDGDISEWDTSSVTNMYCMFEGSKFNGDISGWDVSNVTNMVQMFRQSQFNHDISCWDVSNVKYYNEIFLKCPIKEEYKPAKFR